MQLLEISYQEPANDTPRVLRRDKLKDIHPPVILAMFMKEGRKQRNVLRLWWTVCTILQNSAWPRLSTSTKCTECSSGSLETAYKQLKKNKMVLPGLSPTQAIIRKWQRSELITYAYSHPSVGYNTEQSPTKQFTHHQSTLIITVTELINSPQNFLNIYYALNKCITEHKEELIANC